MEGDRPDRAATCSNLGAVGVIYTLGEFKALRRELKPHLQLICTATCAQKDSDGSLVTRMVKVRRGGYRPSTGSILKVKARQKERTVLLSSNGSVIII